MQLILPAYPTYAMEQEVYVEHNGHTVRWTTAPFSKMNFEEDRAMFKHINQFWASLPPERQDTIFNIYLKIAEIFDSTDLLEEIDQLLSEQLEELFEQHQLAEIRNFAMFHSDIIFPKPPELPAEYTQSTDQIDKNHTREKTYTVADYIDLVSMILQLRIMVPIWGRYIARTNKIAGTMFKEYYAFRLLDHTTFVKEPAIQKLYGYIKSVLPSSGNKADILQGVSSEEFPLWNMSLLVVRKLCLSDIRGLDPTPILIRHISRHIMEKAKRIDPNTDTAVRNKNESSSSTANEEDQISRLEQYKIKEEISRGDVRFLLSQVQDPYAIAQTIQPGVSAEEVDSALSALPLMLKSPAEEAQTILLMWMIDAVVPGETVNFMTNIDRCRALCACGAAYWAKGHYLMAALCTATPAPTDDDVAISGTDSKGRLSKETSEKLEQLFPYCRKTRGSKVIREELTAIDDLITALTAKTWMLNVSNEQMKLIHPRYPQVRRLSIPHNFKELVAQLVIDIASRQVVPAIESITDV